MSDGAEVATLRAELAATRAQLALAQPHLERSAWMASVATVLRGACHEMNNPLTGILGYAQLLLTTVEDPEVRADVEHIELCARRIQPLVERLGRLVRQTTGAIESLLLREAVLEVLAAVEYYTGRYVMTTRVDIPGDIPPLAVDAHRVRTILILVVTDALRRVENHGEGGELSVSARRHETGVAVHVRGSGEPPRSGDLSVAEGMAADDGSRLGLAAAASMLREHGGSMRVVGPPDSGVLILLPLPPES